MAAAARFTEPSHDATLAALSTAESSAEAEADKASTDGEVVAAAGVNTDADVAFEMAAAEGATVAAAPEAAVEEAGATVAAAPPRFGPVGLGAGGECSAFKLPASVPQVGAPAARSISYSRSIAATSVREILRRERRRERRREGDCVGDEVREINDIAEPAG